MHITLLHLANFRNYGSLTLTPHPGINMLLGQNGSGKTNLLEAIHYCALGRSHRIADDRAVVHHGAAEGACGVTLETTLGREQVAVRLMPQGVRKKVVLLNRKTAQRLSDMMGHLQCVMFSPEDLGLVREGPSFRRRFMDMMLSQMVPGYFAALQQVTRTLNQRNALLQHYKRTGELNQSLISTLDDMLKEPVLMMMGARDTIVKRLNTHAAAIYSRVSGRPGEVLTVSYTPAATTGTYDQAKAQSIKQDISRYTTTFGTHREDMVLQLSGRDLSGFASQGQVRTVALALKLAQLHLFQEESGEMPLLLLDDVMSELDMTRRTALLREIDGVQTFVTCTDESDMGDIDNLRTYLVTMGDHGAQVTQQYTGEARPQAKRESFPWE